VRAKGRTREGGDLCWQDQERARKRTGLSECRQAKASGAACLPRVVQVTITSGVGAIQNRSLAAARFNISKSCSDCSVGCAGGVLHADGADDVGQGKGRGHSRVLADDDL